MQIIVEVGIAEYFGIAENIDDISNKNQGQGLHISLIIILFITISTTSFSSTIPSDANDAGNNAYGKYANTQTQSLVNECHAGESVGAPNCAINSPQIHADGTASAPINTQISSPTEEGPGSQGPGGEEGEQGPPGPAGPEKIVVVTLEDNATGNSLGWNPDGNENLFEISAPVEVTTSTFVAATVVNPSTATNTCFLLFVTPGPTGPNAHAGGFVIDCTPVKPNPPLEGATLTYIITI